MPGVGGDGARGGGGDGHKKYGDLLHARSAMSSTTFTRSCATVGDSGGLLGTCSGSTCACVEHCKTNKTTEASSAVLSIFGWLKPLSSISAVF